MTIVYYFHIYNELNITLDTNIPLLPPLGTPCLNTQVNLDIIEEPISAQMKGITNPIRYYVTQFASKTLLHSDFMRHESYI